LIKEKTFHSFSESESFANAAHRTTTANRSAGVPAWATPHLPLIVAKTC